MSLTLVATPIGDIQDISLRALKTLQDTYIIIGEEPKTCRKILTDLEISPRDKKMYFLNEHSTAEGLQELLEICKFEEVCLMSDCGTPAFCDPGADLVKLCRANNVKITTLPGPSSLMTFISMLGERWDQFTFLGFPPRDKNDRDIFFKNLKNHPHPVFFLEAPYRLKSTLESLDQTLGPVKFHLGANLTAPDQEYYFNSAKFILKNIANLKAPFIVGFNPKA
jgi:16S rRNA (cytidine1402-2'-O)-methyltransferase